MRETERMMNSIHRKRTHPGVCRYDRRALSQFMYVCQSKGSGIDTQCPYYPYNNSVMETRIMITKIERRRDERRSDSSINDPRTQLQEVPCWVSKFRWEGDKNQKEGRGSERLEQTKRAVTEKSWTDSRTRKDITVLKGCGFT